MSPWEKYSSVAAPSRAVAQEATGPWAKYSPAAGETESIDQDTSTGQKARAFLEGAGNEISMGYLPQIQAGIESLLPDPQKEVDEQLRAEGFQVPESSYVQKRDENIQRQEELAKNNPGSYIAGQVLGAITSAPGMGSLKVLRAGKDASRAVRFGKAALGGAAYGVARNPGDTEGEISPVQIGDRAENALTGAALGVAGQGVAEIGSTVTKLVKNSPQIMDKFSKKVAFKSLGAGKKEFKRAFGKNAPEEIGEALMEHKIIKTGASVEDMLPEIQALKKDTGAELGNIYKEATSFVADPENLKKLSLRQRFLVRSSKLDGAKLAEAAKGRIKKGFKNSLDNSQVKDRVDSILDNLTQSGDDIAVTDMHEMIRGLDEAIDWSKGAREATVIQDQIRTVRGVLSQALKNRVNAVGRAMNDPAKIKLLQNKNKLYGQMASAERVAKDKINGESANRFFSLTDNIVGAGAGFSMETENTPEGWAKKALYGLAGAVANKGMRKYSLPAVAKASQRMSKILQGPAVFAKFGQPIIEAAKNSPEALATLMGQLSTDPEFKKVIDESFKEPSDRYRGLANGKN